MTFYYSFSRHSGLQNLGEKLVKVEEKESNDNSVPTVEDPNDVEEETESDFNGDERCSSHCNRRVTDSPVS